MCIELHTTVRLPLYRPSLLSTAPLPSLPSFSPLYHSFPLSTVPLPFLPSLSPLYRPSPSLLEAKLPYNVPELFYSLFQLLWLLSWETEHLEKREAAPSSPVPCRTRHATRDSALITGTMSYPARYQRQHPHHQYHTLYPACYHVFMLAP